MKKIPSLFLRDFAGDPSRVMPELNPAAAWALTGIGLPTEKLDGTAVMIAPGGAASRRYDAKHGKIPPDGWVPCEAEPDPNTGHWPGWLPLANRPDEKPYYQALAALDSDGLPMPGTYELIGPKFQRNPYKLTEHRLVRHGAVLLRDAPAFLDRDHQNAEWAFGAVRDYLQARSTEGIAIEGIVWHELRFAGESDPRMAKIKSTDFGIAWPPA